MDEALNEDEAFVRWHARKLLEEATDATCFYGWELGAVARGFLYEGIENYARLAGKQEAIRVTRAFLERLEGAA
jgi:hypothetical protein